MMRRRASWLLASVAVLGAAPGGVTAKAAKAPPPPVPTGVFAVPEAVQDLHYGDVLFYFYQDDYFQAITRLSAAQQQQRVEHHRIEAELLKGGLYLSLGQHEEAGRIFRALLNENVSQKVRNRAWFYLAKIWYQRNYLADAEQALNSIDGPLPGQQESERRLLQAQVLMYQNRFDEAIAVLQQVRTEDEWTAYARYNLGVALVRQDRLADAGSLLDAVGRMPASGPEMLALRDKANLALAFAWLKAERAADAKPVLERIRLEGPYSSKALLAAGWADSTQKSFKTALVPWLELRKRKLLDPAVQESYLAIPYAYAQLGAKQQAATEYQLAMSSFQSESRRIDESIAAIRAGHLADVILEQGPKEGGDGVGNGSGRSLSEDAGWYWQLKKLPDAPETRYLYHLMAAHKFQEGLKNYRDLQLMQRNLAGWAQSVEAFGDMIDTRRRAFAERLPLLKNTLDEVDLPALESHHSQVQSQLAAIEADNDVAALATPREADRWRQVQHIDEVLRRADPADPTVAEMKEKARLLRGVLYWDLNANYKARLWREHKQLRELDVAVKDARRDWTLVERAREEAPRRTEDFAVRVAALEPRITLLDQRLAVAAEKQNRYLADIAVEELQAQKERLAAYALQAQFALASIYDQASDAGGKP